MRDERLLMSKQLQTWHTYNCPFDKTIHLSTSSARSNLTDRPTRELGGIRRVTGLAYNEARERHWRMTHHCLSQGSTNVCRRNNNKGLRLQVTRWKLNTAATQCSCTRHSRQQSSLCTVCQSATLCSSWWAICSEQTATVTDSTPEWQHKHPTTVSVADTSRHDNDTQLTTHVCN